MNLNQEQQAVVTSTAPLILVPAGPGSGKSRVLVERIKHDVAAGADPKRMLAVTFTVSGAKVMQERLEGITLGFIGTLHSFCLKLIQQHHDLIGLPKTISVCDEETATALLETIIAELNCKTPMKTMLPLLNQPNLIQPATKRSSVLKDELCVREFHSRLRESGLLTFDALLFYAEALIPILVESGKWNYDFGYYDEFQDSAQQDFNIMTAMPLKFKLVCFDLNQSIYGFRSAKPENVLRLAQDAPGNGWAVIPLETNYRSGKVICESAQRLIEHNAERIKTVTRAISLGGTVTVSRCQNPASELALVLNRIQGMVNATS